MTTTELLTEHSCEIIENLLPFYTEGSIEPDAAAVPRSLSFHRKYRLHLAFGILCAILAALAVLALLL